MKIPDLKWKIYFLTPFVIGLLAGLFYYYMFVVNTTLKIYEYDIREFAKLFMQSQAVTPPAVETLILFPAALQ